ncbi:NAD(P)/FAD-dependent oxidoreductase [Gorillibacterium massiliense]|uniref:NAD(P)/FAD-dependent oxidoreductase n=1 Tax=Gorillibacterium massiliense TaxID=1280390 RepID=UPI0004B0F992|nr:NAD(P)/FAD-dependent oxidoreductase [Gorillibacterium massiliense]
MYDIIIIGAGPAGSSAGLFTAKAGKKTLIIDNDQSITKRAWIENHYGAADISGPDLLEIGKNQAKKFGAEYVSDKAVSLVASESSVTVETENGKYEGGQLILATGLVLQLAESAGIETKPGTEPRVKSVVSTDAAGKTSLPHVWAAGACAGVSLHTIITAGDGARVAINVISELNGERYVDHDVLKA